MRTIVNNDVIKATCPGCKSVLAIEVSDVSVSDIGSPGQWANCCQCGKAIPIMLEDIPHHWRTQLFED